MKYLVFLLLFSVTACQSLISKKVDPALITYSEFEKIIKPASRLYPLASGDESVVVALLPGDQYNKLYKLNHKSKKFEVLYDAGQNITGLYRDRGDKKLFIMMDNNGDENHKIFSFDFENKKLNPIFGHDKSKAELVESSYDGRYLYITSNHVKKAQYRVYQYDTETGKSVELTNGVISFYEALVDKNNSQLALQLPKSNNEVHIYLLNLKNKSLKKLLAKKQTVYTPSFFHPTEDKLIIASDEGRDRKACAMIDLKVPQKLTWLFAEDDKDIICDYYPAQNLALKISSYNGVEKLELFKGFYSEPLEIKFKDRTFVNNLEFIPGKPQAVIRMEASNNPGDFYIFNPSEGKKAQFDKISEVNLSSIPLSEFAESSDFFYNSFDGMKIHGIVYAKKEYLSGDKKYPLIVWPHGGPDSYESHKYRAFFQYWAQKGFVVFAPNYRGSTGYGKKFETLNDRDWGGAHIVDVIEGKNAMLKQKYIDPNNVFIVGGSFGGFSTLSMVTRHPKEFKAAVAFIAIGNLFTFMKSILPDPSWQGEFLAELGSPVTNKKFYTERSPHFHAKNIQIPLKIYQAENDVRTVKPEMDNFVKELGKYKIPVEYEILYKDGHRISRAENLEKIYQGTIDFLNTQIKK